MYTERLKKVQKAMQPGSIMVLVSADELIRSRDVHYHYRASSDLLYLSGINEPGFALIIEHDAEITAFGRKPDPTRSRWVGDSIEAPEIAQRLGIKEEQVKPFEDFWGKLPSYLKNKETVYFPFGQNGQHDQQLLKLVTATGANARGGDFGPHTLVHTSQILHEMRLYKDAAEIEIIETAVNISALAHNELIRYSVNHQGETVHEFELRALLEGMFINQGAQECAYASIVAGGNNATVLHYHKSDAEVRKGELVLVDAGCELEGYASDITRTFPVGGGFSKVQKDVYQLVLDAQHAALAKCKPGANLGQIHKSAIDVLAEGLWNLGLLKEVPDLSDEKKPMIKPGSLNEVHEKKLYRHYYMHLTSHYLGLDVHDVGNYFIGKEHRPLEPGMLFTVEPGLYFPDDYDFIPDEFKGIGVRIEDDVLIEKSGARILSEQAIKEVADIEG